MKELGIKNKKPFVFCIDNSPNHQATWLYICKVKHTKTSQTKMCFWLIVSAVTHSNNWAKHSKRVSENACSTVWMGNDN